ncbi:MAG: hypothetical protein JW894_08585 [Bacteroidales bacterium]|nr:hypothetical protein [Bacteroidales bacterium]
MKTLFAGLIIISMTASCGLLIKLLSHQNGILDTEGMDNIESPNNDDNTIFITHRIFKYHVSQREINRCINFDLEMVVIPGYVNSQTKIKYKYKYNPADLTQEEIIDFTDSIYGLCRPTYTSVNEDKFGVDIHPPRSYTLRKLQLAPFPDVDFPIYEGRKGKGFLYIPRGNWGEWEKSKIKHNKIIKSVSYKNDSIINGCVVEGTATSKFGISTLEAHFQIDSGFTRLFYRFSDSSKVDFVLKEIK